MIDVLLATYRPNCEWLKTQNESIQAQCGVEVNLIRRDDVAGEGACANFSRLLEMSKSEYVAYADQDDVWLPDKLEKLMSEMCRLEARWGTGAPLLVFSDSAVVDAELNRISDSLFGRIKVDPRRNLPRQLVLQNTAYGNTMLFNAALRDLVRPIPSDAVMHDHWTMLVASVFGHIGYVMEPLLLYRQHGQNIFGGTKVGLGYFVRKVLQSRKSLRTRLYANIRQAEAFVARFGDRAPEEFRVVAGLERRPYLCRVWTLVRHRIFKCGAIRNLGAWAIC